MELRQWKLASQLAQVTLQLSPHSFLTHTAPLLLHAIKVYGAEDVGARIEESRVVNLLAVQDDTSGAGEALSGLPLHNAVSTITSLLNKTISSDPTRNNSLKLFLVQVSFSSPSSLFSIFSRSLALTFFWPSVRTDPPAKRSEPKPSRRLLEAGAWP